MMPKIDYHIHSEFSRCSEDTTIEGIISVAEPKGLERIAVTDHGYAERLPWFREYLSKMEKARKSTRIDVLTGLEATIEPAGNLAVDHSILDNLDIVIAGLHSLPESSRIEDYVEIQVKALEINDFHILAHPTDLFNQNTPKNLSDRIVRKLKEHSIATEMNYHHRCPSPVFIRDCVEAGIRLAPSSDAHRLDEIGHFEWFEKLITGIDQEISWIEI